MRFSSIAVVVCLAAAAALSAGCASSRIAQNKTVQVAGQKLEFGGVYDPRGNELSLSVNGDPVMRGSFPPYTPTLNLNAQYRGLDVRAECYFGSVLGSKGGVVGIVAGAVQSAHSKAGDKCDLHVGGKVVESLYF
ncbi:hypothetical protein [Caldimonas brevitalea]|uniref:Lipoprotein n=1 Tax=Caldimonas brevitalea TaxID=413882 RepID=A0A0G3BQF3_9BURK|nr:hypothetical protein [Caldimonas brevitalea]AKJ31659.1 hypothetical protein AAW51_4968 [Caldimonas brevitalea]